MGGSLLSDSTLGSHGLLDVRLGGEDEADGSIMKSRNGWNPLSAAVLYRAHSLSRLTVGRCGRGE